MLVPIIFLEIEREMLDIFKTSYNVCLISDFKARTGKFVCMDNFLVEYNGWDDQIRQGVEDIGILVESKVQRKEYLWIPYVILLFTN